MATPSTLNQDIIQTKGKAAAKTFLQAVIGAAGVLLLAWITTQTTSLLGGGDVRDIDPTPLIGIAAVGLLGGIAAITSLLMNWAKTPAPPTPVAQQYDEG